jgi:hypothetical protein
MFARNSLFASLAASAASRPCRASAASRSLLGRRLFRLKSHQLPAHFDEALLQVADFTAAYAANLRLEIAGADFVRDTGEKSYRTNEET